MSTTTTTTTEPSPALPPPVNLGDFAAVKRALDDAVSAAVLDAVGGGGEDGRVYWGKVAIGVVRCDVDWGAWGGCASRVFSSRARHACL